jgi:hypothetical protein
MTVAQKVEVLLLDDLDGGQADETVSLGLDGVQYEIDLSKANAAKLRESLAPFVEAGRKSAPRRQNKAKSGNRRSGVSGQPNTHEVREWAKSHGIQVSDRGRIPADVYVKFQEGQAS